MLFTLFEEVAKDSVFIAESRPSNVFAQDEFQFTTKLLPYVIKLFQENYLSGYMAVETATWSIFSQNDEAE